MTIGMDADAWLVHRSRLVENRWSLPGAMTLLRSDEPNVAEAMFMDVTVHNRRSPLAGFLLAGKRPVEVIGPVFDSAEQRF